MFTLAIMAALTVPVVTLSTMESARWLCNFWLQSECCKGRGKEFSGGITTAERAESLKMFGREVVGKEGKFLVVAAMSISFGELVMLFVTASLTD